MHDFLVNSAFFGLLCSLGAYQLGMLIQRKFHFVWLNPLLIAVTLIIALLVGLKIDYESYCRSSQLLTYLLTPATVCLAIPLYEQMTLLKRYPWAILTAVSAGVLASMGGILFMAWLFGLTHEQYVTLLPKSITTAIGSDLSGELGGFVPITVAAIAVTGITGNMLGDTLCRWFHLEEPVAKGLAIGTASHVMGTAKAFEMGEIEGAMSGLATVIAGLLTVIGTAFFAALR